MEAQGRHRTKAAAPSRVGRGLRALSVAALFGCIFAPACGSVETSPTAASAGASSEGGASSGESNGGEMAIPQAGCESGETRECVGPGACDGGQSCGDSGWSACDCGVGGTTANGGAPSAAGAPAAGGESDGGASFTVEEPDPCPPNWTDPKLQSRAAYDCAGDCLPRAGDEYCGSVSNACTQGGGEMGIGLCGVNKCPRLPIFRIPAAMDLGGPCECESGAPIFARFDVSIVGDAGAEHIEVRTPWHFALADETMTTCVPPHPAQCQDINLASSDHVVLWTEDPGAPAVNVYSAPGACP
jgi:hypothetical protein